MFGPDKCGLDNKVSDGCSVYYIYISLYSIYIIDSSKFCIKTKPDTC